MTSIETIKAAHSSIINNIAVGQGLWCNGHHYTVEARNVAPFDMVFIKLLDYKGKVKTIAYDTRLRAGNIITYTSKRTVKHPIFKLSLKA